MKKNNFSGLGVIKKESWPVIAAILGALICITLTLTFSNQPLLESFGFRQTQTALTSYWMIAEGWQLDYQTPVGGYPWSIPFEFPIYQSIVALLANFLDIPLDPVGRILSACFLLACALPALQITKRLKLPQPTPWIFCALLWTCPLYLFWGRTFMIETAALFFTLACIPYAIDLSNRNASWRSALYFSLFASLGMLQKVTTTAPVIMLMGVFVLASNLRGNRKSIPELHYILLVSISFLLPIILGVSWARHTDIVKTQNELGSVLTSTALAKWNFGTLAQRLDPAILKTIFWDRLITQNVAGLFGLLVILYALFRTNSSFRIVIGFSLVLFVTPILIFLNLHFIHTYYQTSSAAFLIWALAASIASLPSKQSANWLIGLSLTTLLIVSNLYHFSKGYAGNVTQQIDATNNATLAVSDVVRRYTDRNSAIVVFGGDWSSEFSYYAQRKSFTVPEIVKNYDQIWEAPGRYLGDKPLGAIVFCQQGGRPNIKRITSHPAVTTAGHLFKVSSCYIWLPNASSITLAGSTESVPPLSLEGPSASFPQGYTDSGQHDVNCEGAIEVVNGVAPSSQKIFFSGTLNVVGWLAVSGKDAIAPDDIFVTLADGDGATYYASTPRIPRSDLNNYFGRESMPNMGYSATIDTTTLHGSYTLGLARGFKGKLLQCAQFKIPIDSTEKISIQH